MADVPKVELAPFTGGADADGVEAKEKAAKAAKHLKLFATRNEMGIGNSRRCDSKTFEIARTLFQRLFLLLSTVEFPFTFTLAFGWLPRISAVDLDFLSIYLNIELTPLAKYLIMIVGGLVLYYTIMGYIKSLDPSTDINQVSYEKRTNSNQTWVERIIAANAKHTEGQSEKTDEEKRKNSKEAWIERVKTARGRCQRRFVRILLLFIDSIYFPVATYVFQVIFLSPNVHGDEYRCIDDEVAVGKTFRCIPCVTGTQNVTNSSEYILGCGYTFDCVQGDRMALYHKLGPQAFVSAAGQRHCESKQAVLVSQSIMSVYGIGYWWWVLWGGSVACLIFFIGLLTTSFGQMINLAAPEVSEDISDADYEIAVADEAKHDPYVFLIEGYNVDNKDFKLNTMLINLMQICFVSLAMMSGYELVSVFIAFNFMCLAGWRETGGKQGDFEPPFDVEDTGTLSSIADRTWEIYYSSICCTCKGREKRRFHFVFTSKADRINSWVANRVAIWIALVELVYVGLQYVNVPSAGMIIGMIMNVLICGYGIALIAIAAWPRSQ
jgi:hypothetical protein